MASTPTNPWRNNMNTEFIMLATAVLAIVFFSKAVFGTKDRMMSFVLTVFVIFIGSALARAI